MFKGIKYKWDLMRKLKMGREDSDQDKWELMIRLKIGKEQNDDE
jgi:hypothetical protein